MGLNLAALLRASHPGPTVVVTAVAAVLGIGLGYGPGRLVILAAVVLAGQLSIGWSNDWLDAARDAAVHRADKPAATGAIAVSTIRAAAWVAAAASALLALLLGPAAAAVNLVCFGMGWVYNLGVKNTLASIAPYLVCFGLLPAVATLGLPAARLPTWWVVAAGALLGAAAHLTNVLPDLDDDRLTGVRGLPHALGARVSGLAAFVALAGVAALITAGTSAQPDDGFTWVRWAGLAAIAVLTVLGVVLTFTSRPTRLLMRLIMTSALVAVVMLATAGHSMLA
ncbi:UbiA family prenyltransferase [Microbacterium sp. STN6]|uniref:UbiA family prenyltransferase n=1 Tax=Microbacterium sp. STN6 TaxID=2995588 RepID=UPI002260D852|nr:UbiA family prenyltransferase [Microbacterium sp. STN6]MCX7522276.1 UbiA family prenyltransferase [Microbacterium sp. STN6]